MPDQLIARSGATTVGIIGLGEAGATIHLPALRGLSDVTVVGAAEPDEARRRAVSAEQRIPVFASVTELLRNTKPSFVIVASPPALHASHAIEAMETGADVLCEKPFAASVQEGRELIARAASLGRHLAVNHEFRAMPIFRDVLAAARGDSGGVVVAQLWQAIHHSPGGERGWRGQLKRRSLYEAGVHLVDVALQLFGESPLTVRASFAPGPDPSSAADTLVLLTLTFSRARMAQVVQYRAHRGDRQYLELRADTASASYRASFGGRARVSAGFLRSSRPHVAVERAASGLAWRERGGAREPLSRNGPAPLVTSTRDVIRDCLAAIRGGKPSSYPATNGLETLRVVTAAYRSADLGKSIDLDTDREALESFPLAERVSR